MNQYLYGIFAKMDVKVQQIVKKNAYEKGQKKELLIIIFVRVYILNHLLIKNQAS